MSQGKTAFVDERLAAREFSSGDVVRKTGLRDFVLSPYSGRVLYSNPEIGKVSVQWPWGVEQETPSELVKWGGGDYIAPHHMDQSYSTWESTRHTNDEPSNKADSKFRKSLASSSLASRVATRYEAYTMPLWRAACKLWHINSSEFDAFYRLSSQYSPKFGEDTIRITVSNLYNMGRQIALYWVDPKRKYRVTKKEKSSGRLCCPRCKTRLQPRIYKQGQRVLLCPSCGFCISQEDLV